MSLPCVVGFSLAEARRILTQAGVVEIEVTETAPLGGPRPAGPLRVLRQRGTQRGLALLAAASIPAPQRGDAHD